MQVLSSFLRGVDYQFLTLQVLQYHIYLCTLIQSLPLPPPILRCQLEWFVHDCLLHSLKPSFHRAPHKTRAKRLSCLSAQQVLSLCHIASLFCTKWYVLNASFNFSKVWILEC